LALWSDHHITLLNAIQQFHARVGLDADAHWHTSLAIVLPDDDKAPTLEGPHGVRRQPKHIAFVFQDDRNLGYSTRYKRLPFGIGNRKAGGFILLLHRATSARAIRCWEAANSCGQRNVRLR
jgi:hypothetical protein